MMNGNPKDCRHELHQKNDSNQTNPEVFSMRIDKLLVGSPNSV